MTDLSIIIPIYNTPQSDLLRCFSSMEAMQGISFEVLLVDDGSEDQVGQFCKAYTARHPEFRYIRKENGGVSSARNLGISQAQGRYLTFVDADDCIIGEVLVQHLPADDNADLVFFDILLTQHGNDSVWSAFPVPEGSLDREQVLYQLCTAASINGPVAKLYKTQLLRSANMQFDPQFISGEDWMFVCDYVLQAKSFLYHPQCAYRYFRTESTGQSRMIRFPDKMLSNQLDRYERKLQIMDGQTWTRHPAGEVYSLAAVELIENLFNSAAVLLLVKQLTPQRRKRICDAVEQAGANLTASAGKKTRLKRFVLLKFPVALWPLAQLRRLYLKLKH